MPSVTIGGFVSSASVLRNSGRAGSTLVQADNYPRLLATSLSRCLSVCSLSRAFRIIRKPLLFRSPRHSPAYPPASKGKVEAKHAATAGSEVFTAKIGIVQPTPPKIDPKIVG
ncbi:hypothetical protein V500_11372 [Pseudogymnoascus sp. VKM F-4518 (FW-2643)]|nr:hypothetical protein V500_11372 [Pseudogymnoascus sp. VKM F-4518 (FW-2643)]KFZ15999.1 hypothetical protein V502_05295 [Pseudogymnoascus sp. VKM F-4520 (FW-2644)]